MHSREEVHLKLWPHSVMQWASSMHTSGSGSMGASAASRLGLPMRSGATYRTLILPSCTVNHHNLDHLPSSPYGIACYSMQS